MSNQENNFLGQKILCPYPKIKVEVSLSGSYIEKAFLFPANAFIVQFKGCKGLEKLVTTWLMQYSQEKNPSITLPLAWKNPSDFVKKTLQSLTEIPFGKCKSYKEIALEIGSPRACRAVGNVCHRNPFILFIPCHRVIQQSGKLGGFAAGENLKKQLLDFESKRNFL